MKEFQEVNLGGRNDIAEEESAFTCHFQEISVHITGR